MVQCLPVDYHLRFSHPLTPLTHCPPRPACRTRPHLPARPFAGYKDALVPRRFSNKLSPSLLSPYSSPFLHRPPGRAIGRTELHLLPSSPPLLPPAPIRR